VKSGAQGEGRGQKAEYRGQNDRKWSSGRVISVRTNPQSGVGSLPESLPLSLVENLPENLVENLPLSLAESLPESLVEHLPQSLVESLAEHLVQHLPESLVEHLPEHLVESPPEHLPRHCLRSGFDSEQADVQGLSRKMPDSELEAAYAGNVKYT